MEKHFRAYTVQHISRNDNNEADKLAKAPAQKQAVDGPYNKLLTVNISSTVALYNEFHACFRC
jgi:hypothetical protein